MMCYVLYAVFALGNDKLTCSSKHIYVCRMSEQNV